MHQVLQIFTSGDGEILSPTYNIHVTEVICNGDHRERLLEDAKKKEVAGLIRRGTWKVVLKEDIEPDANIIMSGRFVLSIKNSGTDEEMLKARFVAQGYRDKAKNSLVHDEALARQSSARLLVGLAAVLGFRMYSTDVQQA
jgi:hypothetical protein